MRASTLQAACASFIGAAIAAPAIAGTETLEYTFSLTNPTSTAWSAVLFEIEPDETLMANDPGYAALFQQIVFPSIEGMGGQSIDGKSATIDFNDAAFDNGDKEVLFEFDPGDEMVASDGFVDFNLTIETPDAEGVPFEIRVQPIFIPSPGTAALAGLGALCLLRRRAR